MPVSTDVQSSNTVALQAAPNGFEPHFYEYVFTIDRPREKVWGWLNNPKTFTDSQVFPWRVEFVSPDQNIPAEFHVGVLSVHHGPLMMFSGVLTEIRDNEYRDLEYYYGSYVGSLRWIRPTRLQFWVSDAPNGGTTVKARLDSLVVPALAGFWTWAQSLVWTQFPGDITRATRK
jgi:hypothetical protein